MIKTDWKILGTAVLVIGLILGMAWATTSAMGEGLSVEKNQVLVYVYDEKGNAIENATVQIITNTSQIVKSGLTDKDGKVILDLNGTADFTGIVKVSADGYKSAEQNITYDNTADKGYIFTFNLEKEGNKYIDKAKDIYQAHKTAVIVGGAVILLLVLLMAFSNSKKIRW